MSPDARAAPGTQPRPLDEVRGIEEFRALRATIRERGSWRHAIVLTTFSVWALTILWALTVPHPAVMLVPLVVLVAGFEVNFSLHLSVERIGRYLAVWHEQRPDGPAAWEQTAPALQVPRGGVDPLFLRLFLVALLAEVVLAPTAPPLDDGPLPATWLALAPSGGAVLAAVRWVVAARYAKGQRRRDEAALRSILRC